METDHQNAVNDNLKLRFSEIGELAADEATLLEYMQKPDWLQVGASVYEQHCKSCHGDEGSGLVGPNLTDDYYKNVEQLSDIAKVVADGAANGSMPGWRTRLHPNEIVLVSAYVAGFARQEPARAHEATKESRSRPWPAAPTTTSRRTSRHRLTHVECRRHVREDGPEEPAKVVIDDPSVNDATRHTRIHGPVDVARGRLATLAASSLVAGTILASATDRGLRADRRLHAAAVPAH